MQKVIFNLEIVENYNKMCNLSLKIKILSTQQNNF